MKNDLIERYIYAVTRRLPRRNRDDVSKELDSLIDDMLQERCGEVLPTEKDVRVVLTELGDPRELYEKYNPDGKKCLIGAPYYSLYIMILKIVAACVAFGTSLACVIEQLQAPAAYWYEAFFSWLSTVASGLVYGFAFVTILFAIFYRKGVNLAEFTNLDDLPEVPKLDAKLSRGESIFDIVFTVVFLIIFLVAPQILCAVLGDTGELVPIFNVEVLRSSWYILVLFSACGIVRESVKLSEGSYTQPVMTTTIVADVASIALACWWLLRDSIMNPRFISMMTEILHDNAMMQTVFANVQYIFLGILLLSLVGDAIMVVVKTQKAK